jgi:hypothetical protein
MDITMKKLLLFLLMGLLVGNAFAEKRHTPKCEMAVYADEKGMLGSQCHMMKRWALSRCLASVAKDREATLDAAYTAAIHAVIAVINYEEPKEVELFIKQYLARDYRSSYFEDVKPSPELNTGKCLDFYDSVKLDSFVVRFLKNREKTEKGRSEKRDTPPSVKRLKPKCEMAVYADPKKQLESQCHLMKRWAMSTCLAYAAKGEEVSLDAKYTAYLHKEITSMSDGESEEFEPLIRGYLARDYRCPICFDHFLKPTPELDTGKCLDLYDSAELDSLVMRVLENREKVGKD